MEQYPIIKYYFLNKLPNSRKSFNEKKGVENSARYLSNKNSARYLSNKKMISDKWFMIILSAVTFIAQAFMSYILFPSRANLH